MGSTPSSVRAGTSCLGEQLSQSRHFINVWNESCSLLYPSVSLSEYLAYTCTQVGKESPEKKLAEEQGKL